MKIKSKCRSTDKELVDQGRNAGLLYSVYYMTPMKSERDTLCGTISINLVLLIVEYWLLRFLNTILTWSTFDCVFKMAVDVQFWYSEEEAIFLSISMS